MTLIEPKAGDIVGVERFTQIWECACGRAIRGIKKYG